MLPFSYSSARAAQKDLVIELKGIFLLLHIGMDDHG
jgi:hypothetical protein